MAVHGVGRVHPRAGTAAGTGRPLHGGQLLIGNLAGGVAAHRLKHLVEPHAPALVIAGQHGAAADKDTGQVQPAGGHEHAGDDFVAVGNEDHRVQRMGGEHDLDGIGDELPGGQGVLHAGVVHGQAVADPDGAELKGDAAGVADAGLNRLGHRIQMGVTGDVIAFGVDHRHKGPLHLGLGDAQGV